MDYDDSDVCDRIRMLENIVHQMLVGMNVAIDVYRSNNEGGGIVKDIVRNYGEDYAKVEMSRNGEMVTVSLRRIVIVKDKS